MESQMFLGDIQQEVRLCAPLHCSYTVEPIDAFQRVTVDRVLEALKQRFSVRCNFIVHCSSEDRVVISFLDHTEAAAARRLAYEDVFLFIDGCRYRFWMDNLPYCFRKTTLDQRVLIKIRKLPLHMWSGSIVEKILSSFCMVDYVGSETEAMEDLSTFTCTARLRCNAVLPPKVRLVVPSQLRMPAVADLSSPLPVHIYTLIIDKMEYLPGITIPSTSEKPAYIDITDTDLPQVYMSASPLVYKLAKKCASTVIMTVKGGSYYTRLSNVFSAVQNCSHLRIQIRVLDNHAYLLSLCTRRTDVDLYDMISPSFQDSILDGEISLCKWSPDYGSTYSTLGYLADLTITDIPCDFCMPSIIEYVLSAFGLVQQHYTSVDRIASTAIAEGNTVYRYCCSVWFAALRNIPYKIQLVLLPAHLANRREISKVINAICSVLEIHVSTNNVLDVSVPKEDIIGTQDK